MPHKISPRTSQERAGFSDGLGNEYDYASASQKWPWFCDFMDDGNYQENAKRPRTANTQDSSPSRCREKFAEARNDHLHQYSFQSKGHIYDLSRLKSPTPDSEPWAPKPEDKYFLAGMSSPDSDHKFWAEEVKRDGEAYEKELQAAETPTQTNMPALQESIERGVDEEQNVVSVLQDMVEERLSQEEEELLQSIVEEHPQEYYTYDNTWGYAQDAQEEYTQDEFGQEYAQRGYAQNVNAPNQEYLQDFYAQQQLYAARYAEEHAEEAYEETPQQSVARSRALALHEELVADESSYEGDNEQEYVSKKLDGLPTQRLVQRTRNVSSEESGEDGEEDGEYELDEDEELYKLHNNKLLDAMDLVAGEEFGEVKEEEQEEEEGEEAN